ncbi:MAG: HlyD family efflux transporter periplasmic adaptor subunit [Planctomycetaceae bacterium]|nr:HlyD family efflux transporter periplasmic adaptor subunit [Planctomycetaceae bacterium]
MVRLNLLLTFLFLLSSSGCEPAVSSSDAARQPRSVKVLTLQQYDSTGARRVAGAVGSWKTEQIGFEVSGRVLWVFEPGAEIEGRRYNQKGEVLFAGTKFAALDPERYELSVSSAQSQVEVAAKNRDAIQADISARIPAEKKAAEAELQLAKEEFTRAQNLFQQGAFTESEFEIATSQYKTAQAEYDKVLANEIVREADLSAAVSQIGQAQQTLKEANRNLADCELHSSFNGQIADVHVVPGSVVSAGTPVATVQMMDPIKIEFEVSAAESRRIPVKGQFPVTITLPDGRTEERAGFVYMVDPAADPTTRTFTVTLLMINRKLEQSAETEQVSQATTREVWRVDLPFLKNGSSEALHVPVDSIRSDGTTDYLWMVTNRTVGDIQTGDPLLKVRKIPIRQLDSRFPFLGNWIFQEIEILDDQFDPRKNFVIDEIFVDGKSVEDFQGDSVILEPQSQWMLRPGDLVSVDIGASQGSEGWPIPNAALCGPDDAPYVMKITGEGSSPSVQKIPIRIIPPETIQISQTQMILPVESGALNAGDQIVSEAAHFLSDGEVVKVTSANQEKP